MSKSRKSSKSQGSTFNHLVIARFDTLPEGVYLIFVSSAGSAHAAASRKAKSLGISGSVAVVGNYPVHKKVSTSLCKSLLASLQAFPFGKSQNFIRGSLSDIARSFAELSSVEPKQVEMQLNMLEDQIAKQEEQLNELKRTNEKFVANLETLKKENRLLRDKSKRLEKENETLKSEIDSRSLKDGDDDENW